MRFVLVASFCLLASRAFAFQTIYYNCEAVCVLSSEKISDQSLKELASGSERIVKSQATGRTEAFEKLTALCGELEKSKTPNLLSRLDHARATRETACLPQVAPKNIDGSTDF